MPSLIMTCTAIAGLAIASPAYALSTVPDRADPGDSAAIVVLMTHAADGWSKHDAHLYSSMLAEDADFTTGVAPVVHGRAAYEARHVPIFAGIYSASHLSNTLRSIRFITPTIASADWDWQMTGIKTPDGQPAPDRAGLVNWLLVKEHGQWWVVLMHNANAPPPGAAAMAPPATPTR